MVYSQSEFMGISWEIIISEYSKKSENKIFNTLEQFYLDFLEFIRNFEYLTLEKQLIYLRKICNRTYWSIKERFDTEINIFIENKINFTEVTKANVLNEVLEKYLNEILKSETIYKSFIDDFFLENNVNTIFDDINSIIDNSIITESIREKLLLIIKNNIEKLVNIYGFSGIIITGYGNKEIYPSIIDIRLFGKLGSNLIYERNDTMKIESEGESIIYPVAQADFIYTFISGIDPSFRFKWEDKIEFFAKEMLKLTFNTQKDEIMK